MEYLHINKQSEYNVELNQDRDSGKIMQIPTQHEITILKDFWLMSYNANMDFNIVEKCLMYYLENENEWSLAVNDDNIPRFKSEWIVSWLNKVWCVHSLLLLLYMFC